MSEPEYMVGSDPCTQGPAHWCQSEENAKKCGVSKAQCVIYGMQAAAEAEEEIVLGAKCQAALDEQIKTLEVVAPKVAAELKKVMADANEVVEKLAKKALMKLDPEEAAEDRAENEILWKTHDAMSKMMEAELEQEVDALQ